MQHETEETRSFFFQSFGCKKWKYTSLWIWLINDLVGFSFGDVKFVRIASFCLNGLFSKHQRHTSNPETNLLPQHHFDEIGIIRSNQYNSTLDLPKKTNHLKTKSRNSFPQQRLILLSIQSTGSNHVSCWIHKYED